MIPMYAILRTPAVIALVGTRVYRDWAGDAPAAPYVVWSLLAAPPDNTMSERPPSDRYSVAVDGFALNEAQSDALLVACQNAVEGVGLVTSGPQSLGKETDTKLWRWTFTVDIHRNR